MSIITENTSLSSAIQPSLVYPSLPRKKHNSYQPAPLFHRYRSIDADDEVSSQDESVINHNTKELQTCIHFASRLIKLRSELRSPSYMRSKTNSLQMTYNDYFQQQQQYHEDDGRSTTTTNKLSDVGRVQSLPNVSQLSNTSEHPYSTKKQINFCEDESEIISLNSSTTDEASQLTYLTELIRRGNTSKKETLSNHHLSLPPKHQLTSEESHRRRLSLTPSSTFKRNTRSLSLRDMIHEVVDEAINTNNDKNIVQPIKRERFSSLALASQLLYASQSSTEEKESKEVDYYKEKTEINEGDLLLLQQQQQDTVKKESNVIAEKIEIQQEEQDTSIIQSKFLSSLKNTPLKNLSTKTITPAAIAPPPPKASQSRDTTKSLFSTLSSDSESEEESHLSGSTSILFHKRKINYNKRRPTAFLVSISPSSAAAATVAKSRRKPQVVRTKLTEVYSAKEKIPL